MMGSSVTLTLGRKASYQLCFWLTTERSGSLLVPRQTLQSSFIPKSSYSNHLVNNFNCSSFLLKNQSCAVVRSRHKSYLHNLSSSFPTVVEVCDDERSKEDVLYTFCDKKLGSDFLTREIIKSRKQFTSGEEGNQITRGSQSRNRGKRDRRSWSSTYQLMGGGTMTQPITVCVEGNIGSGKTTFLKHFKTNSEISVFDEPISKWRDCQGYNLLDLMYKDPQKWSLCFQSYVQLTMLDLHTKAVEQPVKMLERSMFSAHYCFVENLKAEGLMDDAQYAVLSEWFEFANKNLPIKVDLIVYLRTDPEVAFKRIAQRGRSEENSIKLEYLQSVHKLHEDWLVHKKKFLPCPVLTIDANLELEDMQPSYLLCEERLFQKSAVANC